MFEAIKTVDVEIDNPEVVVEPRVPVMIEFKRLGIKVKEVGEGCGPERVSVLRRFCWRRGKVCFVEKQEKCEKTGKKRFHRFLLNGVDL